MPLLPAAGTGQTGVGCRRRRGDFFLLPLRRGPQMANLRTHVRGRRFPPSLVRPSIVMELVAMCERLAELRDAMGRYASSFDPALLSCEDAGLAVVEAAAIERMAATVKALAAARAADGGAWKAAGGRSAAHHLARLTGTSVGQASEVLAT